MGARRTRVTRTRGGGFRITFGFSRAEQAAATQFINALCGRDPLPTCPTCGGVLGEEGAAMGRCDCTEPAKGGA